MINNGDHNHEDYIHCDSILLEECTVYNSVRMIISSEGVLSHHQAKHTPVSGKTDAVTFTTS